MIPRVEDTTAGVVVERPVAERRRARPAAVDVCLMPEVGRRINQKTSTTPWRHQIRLRLGAEWIAAQATDRLPPVVVGDAPEVGVGPLPEDLSLVRRCRDGAVCGDPIGRRSGSGRPTNGIHRVLVAIAPGQCFHKNDVDDPVGHPDGCRIGP